MTLGILSGHLALSNMLAGAAFAFGIGLGAELAEELPCATGASTLLIAMRPTFSLSSSCSVKS